MVAKNKVAKWKSDEVQDLVKDIKQYKVVAIADLTSLPSLQFQKMRQKLKPSAVVRGSKTALMKIAVTTLKDQFKGIEDLNKYFTGVSAIILTNESAFMLSKKLNESKTSAPAKAGQIAPKEIKIPAGPTPFAPGPIIGELGKIGLKTGVEAGKIAIKEEKVVAKRGDVISKDVAGVLAKLKIEPMELGINLVAAYEEGVVFDGDILRIDETEFKNKMLSAASDAFNLSLGIGYPTKENIDLMLRKAFRESVFLADSKDIMTSENVAKLLGKADKQAEALKGTADL